MEADECPAIILADLDSFFASVEVALRPELSGRACAVAGGGRGVILSATYQARKAGVTAGMPVTQARTKCPSLIVLPARMEAYRQCSDNLFAYPSQAEGTLERVSIDEGYWDVTGLKTPQWDKEGDRAGQGAGRWLQYIAQEKFRLTVSIGLAASKTVAKMACEKGKPNGNTAVPCEKDSEFISGLPVGDIPGVGPVAETKLLQAHIKTVGDLVTSDMTTLRRAVGRKMADKLVLIAQGQDSDPVKPTGPPKSVSAEVTAPRDAEDTEACEELFKQALTQAIARLKSRNEGARTITVTHRRPSGKETSASTTLTDPTGDISALTRAAQTLHERLGSARLRLVGVTFSKLSSSTQLMLELDENRPRAVPVTAKPAKEPPALGDIAYHGLLFTHDTFGPGYVQAAINDSIEVAFLDKIRYLDPATRLRPRTAQEP